jgi:Na+-driven multidrug efflux pump
VGQNIGAGIIGRAERITWLGTVVSFATLTLLGAISWLCAPWLVSFFIPNDPEVIAGGAHFVRIMCLAWGGMGIQRASFRPSGHPETCSARWCLRWSRNG